MSPPLLTGGDTDRRPCPGPPLPEWIRPRPLEVACGLILDSSAEAPPLDAGGFDSPRRAVDTVVRRALARPPCLVSFSGGRDSAALLAAAVALARREGLELPIAATYRFPGAPGSQEDRWQEEVITHLGLAEWERITMTDELDCVGPVAGDVWRRHGILWPFNSFFLVPLLERARGGSLLSGVGGDELFTADQWWAARRVMSGRRRFRLRHIPTVGLALSPRVVRRAVFAHRHPIRWPWLHPEVEEAVNRRRAEWQARAPFSAASAVRWWWQSRTRVVISETLQHLAADRNTQLAQPFLEPAVMGAVAQHFGRRGPINRATTMRELFGDVLPEVTVERRTKAFFDEAFFNNHSRAFVAGWDGRGVDPALVDVGRLTATWQADAPDPRSFSLLEAAWSAQAGPITDQRRSSGP